MLWWEVEVSRGMSHPLKIVLIFPFQLFASTVYIVVRYVHTCMHILLYPTPLSPLCVNVVERVPVKFSNLPLFFLTRIPLMKMKVATCLSAQKKARGAVLVGRREEGRTIKAVKSQLLLKRKIRKEREKSWFRIHSAPTL